MKFSVIIPTFNSAKTLSKTLQSVFLVDSQCEIIVSDGGSIDETRSIAQKFGAKVATSSQGRGTQMNEGAKLASGDIFVFLHSDSCVEKNIFDVLKEKFSYPEVMLGTCQLKFDSSNLILKMYAYFSKYDSLLTSFGDQGICVRKNFFERLNGYADWPLFEDVELLQRARALTKIHSFSTEMTTSAVRFYKNGIFRQQLHNGLLIYKYLRGTSAHELAALYEK